MESPVNGTRRTLIGGGAVALWWPALARARDPERIHRVIVAEKVDDKRREWFRARFAERGWVDGRNLQLSFVDVAYAPDAEAGPRAREVVASRPDAILMGAAPQIALFEELTSDIPFVFYNLGGDPAKVGLVESLRRPGGNITGTSLDFEQMWPKALEMLKEIHPAMKRGGVLLAPTPSDLDAKQKKYVSMFREAWQAAGRHLGIEIQEVVVPVPLTLEAAVGAIREARCDALAIQMGIPVEILDGLTAFLAKSRIPACGLGFRFARRGGLLAVSFDSGEGQKQAIATVARILGGESPATIPIYVTNRYGFAVNLRTASAMGLTVPAAIVVQATEVIE